MVENLDNCIQVKISRYQIVQMGDPEGYLKNELETAKRILALKVFDSVFNAGTPVVLDTFVEQYQELDFYMYRIHYRTTAVQKRDVIISALVFTNHLGMVEWKCPYCSMINPIEATYCGEKHDHAVGCGSPREKTKQEM